MGQGTGRWYATHAGQQNASVCPPGVRKRTLGRVARVTLARDDRSPWPATQETAVGYEAPTQALSGRPLGHRVPMPKLTATFTGGLCS